MDNERVDRFIRAMGFIPTDQLRDQVRAGMRAVTISDEFTVEPFTGADGDHWWRLRHRNGHIVASSGEGYRNASHRDRMVERLFPGVTVGDV